MGANIRSEQNMIVVEHTDTLSGAVVDAGEIRAGASLMITAMMAEGITEIEDAENILRGYDSIIRKLTALHAVAKLENSQPVES